MTTSTIASRSNARQGALVACALAFLIGGALVFTTGFAGADVLHNAAHDTRHALSFPCH
ncbi:CbtB domain-containing protein [Methylobrevis pamukkalensis]|uniref:Putative cobalt transporter subunit (CbtB) n=1 Tax=Methylobrevis pamukkalensis TaxID=1439726 RepID=A0A1E3H2S5_9HYPH|nr:CbtB domain-containing protein [Methylobrevis pamukkalensis]ODN69851.1 putative cobalt transporter subunit (CbtB) [Methylobrevis pamukkalensis]